MVMSSDSANETLSEQLLLSLHELIHVLEIDFGVLKMKGRLR